MKPARPLIGITADLSEGTRLTACVGLAYAQCVQAAGGTPFLLPPIPDLAEAHAETLHGFVFSGGGDPQMEPFGSPTHPAARTVHPQRQEYETRLFRLLEDRFKEKPVLGICLGMQMMSLCSGGALNQHLPDSLETADQHGGHEHVLRPLDARFKPGQVASFHHQAVADPGRLRVLATSDDGVIEAVEDPSRPFYLGVQWHPERTSDDELGLKLFRDLVAAAGR